MLTRIRRTWLPLLLIITFFTVLTLQLRHQGSSGDKTERQSSGFSRPKAFINTQNTLSSNLNAAAAVQPIQNLDDVFNRTLGFQKVFAINLPSRRDKRDALLLSSRVTGFDIEFIDGVDPSTITNASLPQMTGLDHPIAKGVLGCWRAHMNFIMQVVEEGLSSALVLEDDVDWDARLLSQLKDFAIMSNAVLGHANSGGTKVEFDKIDPSSAQSLMSESPYGDGWDVILLGNCGVDIDYTRPYVIRNKDQTVADLTNLHIFGDPANLRLNPYPSHTRIAMYAVEQTCTYGYAISQKAARQLVIDLERIDLPFDFLLRNWCEGKDTEQSRPRKCIGVLPTLFDSYRPAGPTAGDSDIDGDKYHLVYREKAMTPNIRKSVRLNMEKLINGETDLDEQYPDFSFGTRRPVPAKSPFDHP